MLSTLSLQHSNPQTIIHPKFFSFKVTPMELNNEHKYYLELIYNIGTPYLLVR